MAVVVARDPHLVGTDVRQQDVVRAEGLTCVPQRFLGPDRALLVVVGVFGKVSGHGGAGLALAVQIKRQ